MTPTADINLIKEYLSTKSSSAAFTFVGNYQNAVFGMCYRILKVREEAEEAAQDSFIKFFESLHKLQDVDKFKSWLMSIAYRTAIDYHRKKKAPAQDLEALPQSVATDQSNPDKVLRSKQRLELLEGLFAQLSELDATLLQLYYVQDMTIRDIADTVDQSESNVKVRLMRSREVLKKKMSPNYKEELKP